MNRIVVSGRLGKDPEERTSQGGVVTSKFSVAVDRLRKDSDGNKVTDWFQVIAFGKSAEFCNRYLTKGNHVIVDGRCEIDNWTDRDDNKRVTVQIMADNVQNVTPREDSGQQRDEQPRQQRREPPAKRDAQGKAFEDFDDDSIDPFAEDD